MPELLYDLPFEKVFDDGTIVLTYEGCIEMAKRNKNFHKHFVEDDARFTKYNRYSPEKVKVFTGEEQTLSRNWILPDEYSDFDIYDFCYTLAKPLGEEYTDRVDREYAEFEKRELVDALRFMKLFVDVLIEKNIMWGVGRGSSCASLLLYLLGVNRIDPIKYDIPLEEFLR